MKIAEIKLKCGCFIIIYTDEIGAQAGLSCCSKHEAPNQKLEKLGQIEVEEFIIERPFKKNE
jgi:hypothetical protein